MSYNNNRYHNGAASESTLGVSPENGKAKTNRSVGSYSQARVSSTPSLPTTTANSNSTASELPPSQDRLIGLDMSQMGLRTIGFQISAFKNITTLLAQHNNLTEFPVVICTHLLQLSHLNLSYNQISKIPTQIENLVQLETLVLNNNLFTELPMEMGRLWKLNSISLNGNRIVSPSVQVLQQGAKAIVSFFRDMIPPVAQPSERSWLQLEEPDKNSPNTHRFKVLSYNILAESYATQDRHLYTPFWALDWDYRKLRILQQIENSEAEVICLQEVEAMQFSEVFRPKMQELGYAGVFKAKSRARTMEDWSSVDGCAIFFKSDRFKLIDEALVEYQSLTLHHFQDLSGDRRGMERLMSKDNIASIVVLQCTNVMLPASSSRKGRTPTPRKLIVCNTHIHWDPTMSDVKLLQCQFLMEELGKLLLKHRDANIPMIVAGDFNSEPDSGVYQLISKGSVPSDHPDLKGYHYGPAYSQEGLKHGLKLQSAYSRMGEPPFTNYNGDFMGVLDYIWGSSSSLKCLGVLQPISVEDIRAQKSPLPNPHFPSDHICIMAEYEFIDPTASSPNLQQPSFRRTYRN